MKEPHPSPRSEVEHEDAFGRHVAAYLTVGVHDMDEGVAARLRWGRQRALSEYRAGAGFPAALLGWVRRVLSARPVWRQTVALAAVVVLVGVGDYWSTSATLAELEAIDAALLADELPIDAYLDADFSRWLRQDSSS